MTRLALLATALMAVAATACTAAPVATPSAPPATRVPAMPSAAPATPAVPPATATPAPITTPSPLPPHTAPAPSFPEGSVIVTFAVEAEQFRALLTDPADIAIAYALLAGEEAPSIPNGLIAPGDGGFNQPWSWHLDPESIEFADVTIEVCDGLPSDVESGALTSDRYCPWGAVVVDVEPADEPSTK